MRTRTRRATSAACNRFALMVQLLLRDVNRGWETINSDPARVQAVTAEDIKRVANTYFTPENRTIGVYYTKKGAGADDPLLTGLDEQEKTQVGQLRAALGQMKLEQVKGMLTQIEGQSASAPADKQDMLKVVKKLLEDRLKQLEGAK